MSEVREFCDEWRMDYNWERPHKALRYLPPVLYAEKWYKGSKHAQALYPQMTTENRSNVFGSQLVDKVFEKTNSELKTLDLN